MRFEGLAWSTFRLKGTNSKCTGTCTEVVHGTGSIRTLEAAAGEQQWVFPRNTCPPSLCSVELTCVMVYHDRLT